MWFLKRRGLSANDREQLVRKIENDVRTFVVQELITYRQNNDNKTLGDSVIVNMALFDFSALNYQDGIKQMENLLSDHTNQLVNRRMKQLLHTLYVRYGIDNIDDIANDSLTAMVGVYNLNVNTISDLDEKFNIFWLVTFIREAYFSVMQGPEESTEHE